MTIDEAIEHCKEIICEHNECANEHKQLVQWLTELKEYKEQKLEQKSTVWSEEDKNVWLDIKSLIDSLLSDGGNSDYTTYELQKMWDWLDTIWQKDRVLPKQEWSEEDNRIRKAIIDNIQAICEEGYFVGNIDKDILIDWLKSLKDRIQPKQEWKQENTGDLTDFENAMMHIGNSFFGQYAGLDPNDTNAIKEQANFLLELVPSKEWSEEDERLLSKLQTYVDLECFDRDCNGQDLITWLKSLKDRYTWKPTEEQLRELKNVFSPDTDSWDEDILRGLYEQIKKL